MSQHSAAHARPSDVPPLVVGQLMRWPAPILSPQSTVAEAAAALADHMTDHAVVAVDGGVCGLLCALDLAELDSDEVVMWRMTNPAAIIPASMAAHEAAALLAASESCAAVVDTGEGFGVLGRDAIADAGLLPVAVCERCGSAHRGRLGDPTLCGPCANRRRH